MSIAKRSSLVAFLLASLALASDIVTRSNAAIGCWCVFALLLALPMAFASMERAQVGVRMFTIAAFFALVVLDLGVRMFSTWSVAVFVHDGQGDLLVSDERTYLRPSDDPACVPFQAINDQWAVLKVDDTPCTIVWSNGSDSTTMEVPMHALLAQRAPNGPGPILPLLGLMLICASLLLLWGRAFFKQLPPLAQLIRSGHGLSLTFVIGILIASTLSPPHHWLDNEFLSRPDDWLCYEKGARAILGGNLLLMPPPGGVELWSFLYTPFIAALHLLLGPATSALYVVQFAAYLLLVPLCLRVIAPLPTVHEALIGLGALLFVLVDVNLNYAWRLLSDVLPLLLLVWLFIALRERRGPVHLAVIGGLLYLVRLEFLFAGVLVFVCHFLGDLRMTTRDRWRFIGVYALFLLPYLLRWWMLYGNLRPFPVAMGDTGHMHLAVMLAPEHLFTQLRAVLGDYAAINPDLRTRYHWFALHALFLFAVGWMLWRRQVDRRSILALLLLGYVVATRAISPSVGIYGHRHSLAVVFLEIVVVVLAIEAATAWKRATAPSPAADPSAGA